MARDVLADWSEAATSSAANLRSRLAEDPTAADVHDLVDELRAASAEFAAVWTATTCGRAGAPAS